MIELERANCARCNRSGKVLARSNAARVPHEMGQRANKLRHVIRDLWHTQDEPVTDATVSVAAKSNLTFPFVICSKDN